jgi:hypothetical protein
VIEAREFQTWIDWLVRDGQLEAGRVQASAQFNPYARSPESAAALTYIPLK